MQITSKFTIAIHTLACIEYFNKTNKVTSEFISNSTNVNPVIIRTILGQLKKAKIVSTRQGSGGAIITRALDEINLFDIYNAVNSVSDEGLFSFHDSPNFNCPIGRNIKASLSPKLEIIQKNMESDLKGISLKEVIYDVINKIGDEKNE